MDQTGNRFLQRARQNVAGFLFFNELASHLRIKFQRLHLVGKPDFRSVLPRLDGLDEMRVERDLAHLCPHDISKELPPFLDREKCFLLNFCKNLADSLLDATICHQSRTMHIDVF